MEEAEKPTPQESKPENKELEEFRREITQTLSGIKDEFRKFREATKPTQTEPVGSPASPAVQSPEPMTAERAVEELYRKQEEYNNKYREPQQEVSRAEAIIYHGMKHGAKPEELVKLIREKFRIPGT